MNGTAIIVFTILPAFKTLPVSFHFLNPISCGTVIVTDELNPKREA